MIIEISYKEAKRIKFIQSMILFPFSLIYSFFISGVISVGITFVIGVASIMAGNELSFELLHIIYFIFTFLIALIIVYEQNKSRSLLFLITKKKKMNFIKEIKKSLRQLQQIIIHQLNTL